MGLEWDLVWASDGTCDWAQRAMWYWVWVRVGCSSGSSVVLAAPALIPCDASSAEMLGFLRRKGGAVCHWVVLRLLPLLCARGHFGLPATNCAFNP